MKFKYFVDDDTDDYEHNANEDKNKYGWRDHEGNNSYNDEDVSDDDDDPLVDDMNVPRMEFQVETTPNNQQVLLPMDATNGNKDAGEIKREADEMEEMLSNGGVLSCEEELMGQVHDAPDEDDTEKRA